MTWDKNKPDGALAVSVGDNDIRLNMDHLETTLSKEHNFPGPASGSGGEHLEGSARLFFQTATPAPVVGLLEGHIWWDSADKHLRFRDASSWESIGNYGIGNLAARDAISAPFTGFAWVRTDDTNIDVWDGAAWRQMNPARMLHWWAGLSGSLPLGYALCDGLAKVGPNVSLTAPDLRGVFLVGSDPGGTVDVDYDTTDPITTPRTGGKKEQDEVPPHDHTLTTDIDGAHTHDVQGWEAGFVGSRPLAGTSTDSPFLGAALAAGSEHSHSGTSDTTGPTGHDPTPDNQPKYYAAAVLIKI